MSPLFKFLKSKAFYVAAGLLLQAIILFGLVYYFSSHFAVIYYIMTIVSVLVAVIIAGKNTNSANKLAWVFIMLALPVFGWMLYFIGGRQKIPDALMIKNRQAYSDYKEYARQNVKALEEAGDNVRIDKMASMAWTNGFFPLYQNCEVTYFPTGMEQCQAIIEAMSKATDFIFVETFILDAGRLWESILKVMIDKAKEGVDVRMVYDDFGAFTKMDDNYDKYLRSQGIKAYSFNPMKPQLNIQMNYRDHRKMIIVDGKTAFTGGINIADEYVNLKKRFGYWKDMGMSIKGPAVEQFTIAFLQIWNYVSGTNAPYEKFRIPQTENHAHDQGYVLPFFDAPTDEHDMGKNVHMNMINMAKDYLWISTPYLVLDSEMISTIKLAAANGVDVRIVVPGIPDKKMVYEVTQSNFEPLVKAGVKVYIYEPGFIHGKVCLSDDCSAMVGTVNMDSRSYSLNYECGVWMYDTSCIPSIKKDFEKIFKASREVTVKDCEKTNVFVRFWRSFLSLFSPLL